jgi:hypothetical protein
MKKLLLLVLAGMMMFAYGCNDDSQNIQREEEMNRGDMVEDDYDQSDIGTGSAPSNLDSDINDEIEASPQPTKDLEEGAPSTDPSQGLEEGAPRNIQQ